MNKTHHPRNRHERKQLEIKHKNKGRPAKRKVEALEEEADNELHGEFLETEEHA